MTLLIQSAMIFFGTLMVAGLVALGEPRATPAAAPHDAADPNPFLVLQGAWAETTAPSGR